MYVLERRTKDENTADATLKTVNEFDRTMYLSRAIIDVGF